jgi:hypothetical protein
MSEELRIERDKLKASLAEARGDIHSVTAMFNASEKNFVNAVIERDSAHATIDQLLTLLKDARANLGGPNEGFVADEIDAFLEKMK